MAGIERLRRDQGQNVGFEIVPQPLAATFRQLRDIGDLDALRRQLRPELRQDRLLAVFYPDHRCPDRFELLTGGEAVDRRLLYAAACLAFQPGDADHSEFVEVTGGDREEPQPLEQRIAFVLRLAQHAAVECQPAQFTIDVAACVRGEIGGDGLGGVHADPFGGRCYSAVSSMASGEPRIFARLCGAPCSPNRESSNEANSPASQRPARL